MKKKLVFPMTLHVSTRNLPCCRYFRYPHKKIKNSFMLNNTFCIAKKEKEIFFWGYLHFAGRCFVHRILVCSILLISQIYLHRVVAKLIVPSSIHYWHRAADSKLNGLIYLISTVAKLVTTNFNIWINEAHRVYYSSCNNFFQFVLSKCYSFLLT